MISEPDSPRSSTDTPNVDLLVVGPVEPGPGARPRSATASYVGPFQPWQRLPAQLGRRRRQPRAARAAVAVQRGQERNEVARGGGRWRARRWRRRAGRSSMRSTTAGPVCCADRRTTGSTSLIALVRRRRRPGARMGAAAPTASRTASRPHITAIALRRGVRPNSPSNVAALAAPSSWIAGGSGRASAVSALARAPTTSALGDGDGVGTAGGGGGSGASTTLTRPDRPGHRDDELAADPQRLRRGARRSRTRAPRAATPTPRAGRSAHGRPAATQSRREQRDGQSEADDAGTEQQLDEQLWVLPEQLATRREHLRR